MALPYAPGLWDPADGGTIIRSFAHTFWAEHSPVNNGIENALQAGQMRSRLAGSSTWSVPRDHSSLTSGFGDERANFDLLANAFDLGAYELSFRTATPDGYGPWSQTSFFTAADVPAAPVITSSALVNATPWTLTWTAAGQDAYQFRRLADAAGAPGAVLWTGPEVVSTARQGGIVHPIAPATEHQQVRVHLNNVWSAWGSLRATVNYTYPAFPIVSLRANIAGEPAAGWPAGAAIVVEIDNPAGGPTVVSNAVQRQQSTDGQKWTNERGVEFEWDDMSLDSIGDGFPYTLPFVLAVAAFVDTRVAHRMRYRYRAVAFTATSQTRTGPGRTWQEIVDTYATWADVIAAFPTWRDMTDLWVEEMT